MLCGVSFYRFVPGSATGNTCSALRNIPQAVCVPEFAHKALIYTFSFSNYARTSMGAQTGGNYEPGARRVQTVTERPAIYLASLREAFVKTKSVTWSPRLMLSSNLMLWVASVSGFAASPIPPKSIGRHSLVSPYAFWWNRRELNPRPKTP